MKTIFRKAIALLALTVMLLPVMALAEARYPVQGSALTDDANALSQSMAQDIQSYAQTLQTESGVSLHVALVLFLDGEPVQTYADSLFTRWELTEDDLLLLGSVAEDSFAIASGANVKAKLSDASIKNLLYASGFSENFKAQRYEMAMGAYFVAMNDLVNKQYNLHIVLGDRFAEYQTGGNATAETPATTVVGDVQTVVAGVVQSTNELWTSTINSINDSVTDYQNYHQQNNAESGGLTPGGWIVLAIIVLIIFGQSEPARRARRRGGCGCSPIGWILSGFGIGTLFNRRWESENRQRRHWR